jgi:methionyl-tRNA synthetase
MKRTLITSALPYANGHIHLGHVAGAYLTADIFARYKRLKGDETLYVCGSDEHGVAITIAAEKEKVTPKDIIDKYHYANKEAFEKLGISFDIYSRTSHVLHVETALDFFKDFLKKGYLIEKDEDQFFDPKANMFLPDRYVEGICPNCGSDKARGDQCDSCGAYYDQLKLKNPKSLVSGETPIVKRTTHWYMQFDKFQGFLKEFIESHAGDWKDNVLQQSRSWLKQGFTERAITRDLSWGVKIDSVKEIPADKSEGKALYVWFEAVLGYITATKELMLSLQENGKGSAEDWKKWWKDPETRYLAFIGKDNIVFHTLIFPAMLHAREDGFILPNNVPANEFLNLEGQKFSKSRNWSIDVKDFEADFPQANMISALRYCLAMNFPESKDADFSWKDFQARNNNELSAVLGNFVNRALQFLHKNFEGKTPELSGKYSNYIKDCAAYLIDLQNAQIDLPEISKYDSLNANDAELLKSLFDGIDKVSTNYDKFRFRDALTESMNIARAANKYFNDEEPWKAIKVDRDLCAKTVFMCVQLCKALATIFAPVIPFSSEKIFDMLNEAPQLGSSLSGIQISENYWIKALELTIESGRNIKTPELLFARIEDEFVEAQVAKLGDKKAANESPAKEEVPLIEYDDFAKVQLRVGRIMEAENIKKSKKLLKLQVDLGDEKRQIVAGIAEHYKAEDMIGKTVTIVANLKPVKLMGVESHGMILAASNTEGILSTLRPEKDEIGPGAEVR